MPSPRYALVTYVRSSVGQFVEELRRELHPETAHMAAHVTILPPRTVQGSERIALEFLEEACSHIVPFNIELGNVETFLPATPTVFIQVKESAQQLRQLHDQLSVDCLCCAEDWPYMPHLTIMKAAREQEARDALTIARDRWQHFSGKREIHVSELMYVRENDGRWFDVGPVPLGRALASPRS